MTKTGLPCTVVCLMFWLVSSPGGVTAQQTPEAKSTLAQVQAASLARFTLEVEVDRTMHQSLRGQGGGTRIMRITMDRDATAIVWKVSDLAPPQYYPPDTPGYQPMDYDAEGNLKLAMWSEGATFRDQTLHEEYSESIGYLVAPDGGVLRETPSALLNRYRPSESNTVSLNLLRRILWALGRPDVAGLREVTSEATKPEGTQRVQAVGWWATGAGSGVSELLTEPDTGYIVRHASFAAEGEEQRAQCHSEGSRRFGDVVLAERGEFSLPSVETIVVRLVSFSPTFDLELVGEVRKVIARAQTRLVKVLDSRDDQDRPKVRLVPAGDLDKEK